TNGVRQWADDGASRFYVNAVDHSLMSAQIFSAGNGIEIAPASEVLTLDNMRYSSTSYEPISGDEGFLIYSANTIDPMDFAGATRRLDAVLVYNIFDELNRLAPSEPQ
ncbi:MAG: hypothetical protein JKY98_07535, partial [Gammaproteobacteria bacterium]|nr:hypothetical protein [Gammaproteobacteria bacterium]